MRRLLDRNVSDLGSLEDFGDVRGGLPMHGGEIGAVRILDDPAQSLRAREGWFDSVAFSFSPGTSVRGVK